MSTPSGLGRQTEKGKAKFTSININTIYKGKSVETQKSTVPRQHGLQSLGKVGSARRMPPPASLPSLKSENSGNDPNVNLVPSGPGWGKENNGQNNGQQPGPQLSQATGQLQGQTKQTTQSQIQTGAIKQTQQPSSTTNTSTITTSTGGNNNSGSKSWSSITQGNTATAQDKFSRGYFQEDFPTLATDKQEGATGQQQNITEKSHDMQYGPGPNLRPQNVGNWREGGGLGGTTTGGSGSDQSANNEQGGQQKTDGMMKVEPQREPPSGQAPLRGAMPGGPMPPHPMMTQFRGMIPPYMYRGMPGPGQGPGPPSGPFPPHNFPGMRPPYPYDSRYGPPTTERRRPDKDDDTYKRPSIIKEKDLKDFDDIILDSNDSGWAGATGEIDYSEKLVFSDDEDAEGSPDKGNRSRTEGSSKQEGLSQREWDSQENESRNRPGGRDERTKESSRAPPSSRAAWEAQQRAAMPPGGRHPGDGQPPFVRMPFDHRGPMPPYHPQFRMGPRPPYPGATAPAPAPAIPRRHSELEEDEIWRQRRQQQSEEMSHVFERARLRREEEEKRFDDERKERAREKLNALDKKSPRRDEDGTDVDREDKVEGRKRTESEGSDKSSGPYREKMPARTSYKNTVPPRFQKSQDGTVPAPASQQKMPPAGQAQAMTSQGARQHMPPPWYDPRDPRTWGPYPPPHMMHPGMMYQGMRRRTESDRSNDNEEHTDRKEPYEREGRGWDARSPYGAPPVGYEDMRRPVPAAPFDGTFADFDRHEYDIRRQEYERRMYEQHKDKERERDKRDELDVERRERAPLRESHDSDRSRGEQEHTPTEILRQDSSRSSDSSSTKENKVASRSAEVQRDPFEEDSMGKKDDVTKKEAKIESDTKSLGKISESVVDDSKSFRRERRDDREDRNKKRYEDRGSRDGWVPLPRPSKPHSAPLPITPQYARQVEPPRSNYTSLKRGNNAASHEKQAEKKQELPKQTPPVAWGKNKQEEEVKDSGKNVDAIKKIENKQEALSKPELEKSKTAEGKDTEEKRKGNDRLKREESRDSKNRYDYKRDNDYRDRDSRPPVKRMKDDKDRSYSAGSRDKRDRREDYDRSSSRGRGRGREFVRGGTRGGRGSYSSSTRGGRTRGTERGARGRSGGSGRFSSQRGVWEPTQQTEVEDSRKDASDWSESEGSEVKSRLRGRDETSDVSADDASGPASEASSEKVSDSRETSSEKETNEGNKGQGTLSSKSKENVWRNSPWSKKLSDENIEDNEESEKETSGVAVIDPKPKDKEKELSRHEEKGGEVRGHEERGGEARGHEERGGEARGHEERGGEARGHEERGGEARGHEERGGAARGHEERGGEARGHEERGGEARGRGARRRDTRDNRDNRDRRSYRGDRDRDRDRDRYVYYEEYEYIPRSRDSYEDQSKNWDSRRGPPRGESSSRGRSRGGRGSQRGSSNRYSSAPSTKPVSSGGFGKPPTNPKEDNVWKPLDEKQEKEDSFNKDKEDRDKSYRRNESAPPRFTRGGGRTTSSSRAERGGRGRGSTRGARGSAVTSSHSASRVAPPIKKSPQLNRHNSVDLTNPEQEEWETASESSDFDRRERREESKKDNGNKDRKDAPAKRSFSNQRPNNQSRRSDIQRARSKEKTPPTKVNGVAGGSKSNGKPSSTKSSLPSKADNVAEVYRVDQVTHDDPNAIKNALNNINKAKKKDINDNTKPVKSDQEKKAEVLANIDINNYASVVVIDDQPEVSHEDLDMLFESNEGFQEVTSKKSLKIRQKAAAELELKKADIEKKLKEKDMLAKALAKPRNGALTEKSGRVNKLPPRLANKQGLGLGLVSITKERRVKEKVEVHVPSEEMSFNIGSWDNEMLKITARSQNNSDSKPMISIVLPTPIGTSMAPVAIGSWDKSMVEAPHNILQQQADVNVLVEAPKYDKSDQHDSGIDISEPPNSQIIEDGPKAPRQTKVRPDRAATKVGPIELPRSFGDFSLHKNDESAELKLDFTFDAELAKLTDEKPDHKLDEIPDQPKPIPLPHETVPPVGHHVKVPGGLSATSPATDLGMKLECVKNLWDSPVAMSTVFEGSSNASHGVIDPIDTQSVSESNFTSFAATMVTAMGNVSSSGVSLDNNDMSIADMSGVSMEAVSMAAASMVTMDAVMSLSATGTGPQQYIVTSTQSNQDIDFENTLSVSQAAEASNVCKVRPQQLQTGELVTSEIPQAAVELTNMSNNHQSSSYVTPQVSQYQPFQTFTNFLQDTRYNYNLTQPQTVQPPAPAPAPVQPVVQPQAYNTKASLFLHANPGNDVYGSHIGYNRNQATPFGQAPQPSTIMVSSGNSSLMSATIKAPNQNAFASIQKNPLQQAIGSNQPAINQGPSQQLFVQFDPASQLLSSGQLVTASQNAVQQVNNSANNSQIMYQRNVPSFYSQPTPQQSTLGQTGFYQAHQATGNLPTPVQQPTNQGHYSVQGFGLAVQPAIGSPSGGHMGIAVQQQTSNTPSGQGLTTPQAAYTLISQQPQSIVPQQQNNTGMGYVNQSALGVNPALTVSRTQTQFHVSRSFTQQPSQLYPKSYGQQQVYGQAFKAIQPGNSSVIIQPPGNKTISTSQTDKLQAKTSLNLSSQTTVKTTLTDNTSDTSVSSTSTTSALGDSKVVTTASSTKTSSATTYKGNWSIGQNKGPKLGQFAGLKGAPFLPAFGGHPAAGQMMHQQLMLGGMFGVPPPAPPPPTHFAGPRGNATRPNVPASKHMFSMASKKMDKPSTANQKADIKSVGPGLKTATFKDQQAKQRAELLKATQSFLNPANKPRPKEYRDSSKEGTGSKPEGAGSKPEGAGSKPDNKEMSEKVTDNVEVSPEPEKDVPEKDNSEE